MATGGKQYDVILTNGSTEIPLMLATDEETGLLSYKETVLKGAAEKITTAQPGLTDLDPEWSIRVPMESWHLGIGQEFLTDPYRGGTSTGADTSFENTILPGPRASITTLTPASTDAGTNGGFELTDTTEWTISGSSSLAAQTATKRTGSYAGRWGTAGTDTPAVSDQLRWTLASAGYTGKAIVFTVYAQGSVTGFSAKPFVTDDDGTTYAAAVAISNSAWTAIQISKVGLEAGATIIFGIEITAIPGAGTPTVFIDDATALFTADSTFGKFCDHEGGTYFALGGVVYQYTGTEYLPRWCSAVGITDLASFGDYMLIARGASNDIAYVDDATARTGYTIMTASGNLTKGNFFTVLGVDSSTPPVPIVYKLRNPNDLDSSVNPTVTWTNTADIGSSQKNFTGSGAGAAGTHYMGKTNQLWSGSTAPIQVLPKTHEGPGNFSVIHTAPWGWTYFTGENGGILARDPDTFSFYDISPARLGPAFVEMASRCVALASDDNWLYAFLDLGTNHSILKGRPIGDRFAWSCIGYITQDTVKGAWVAKVGGVLRLHWAGTHNSALTAGFMRLPSTYNPLDDSSHQYTASSTFTTPWLTGGFPGMNKSLSGIHVEAKGIKANEYLGVEYQKWGDSGWTAIDTQLDNNDFTNDVAEKFLSTFVVSPAFRFYITFVQNNVVTTTPAQLKRFVVFMRLVPPKERLVSLRAIMWDEMPLRMGGRLRTPLKTLLDNLRTAKTAAMLTVNDVDDTSWKGGIIGLEITWQRDKATNQRRAIIDLLLKEDRTS